MIWLRKFGIDTPAKWSKAGRIAVSSPTTLSLPYGNDMAKWLDAEGKTRAYLLQQGRPIAAFLYKNDKTVDENELREHCRKLWNQGLASVLVLQLGNHATHVYSLLDKSKDRDLPYKIREITDSIQREKLINELEDGRLWRNEKEHFPAKNRVDQHLLGNMTTACTRLQELKMPHLEAQSLLLQVLFIAYLEDRNIITSKEMRHYTENKHNSLESILAQDDILSFDRLFFHLRQEFNGDVFLSPCHFDDKKAYPLKKGMLSVLTGFRRSDEDASGQRLLFRMYDFKYIPVTLLSAIYDRFQNLKGDDSTKPEPEPKTGSKSERRKSGSYYTPLNLAQVCLSYAWKFLSAKKSAVGNFAILDPACGSAVFLVCAFQRLVGIIRQNNGGKRIAWKQLIQVMTQQIHGCDKDNKAIRVGIISLYIALLEYMEPPSLAALRKKGRILPALLGKSMFNEDFFSFEGKLGGYDLIIGNPPWSKGEPAFSSVREWFIREQQASSEMFVSTEEKAPPRTSYLLKQYFSDTSVTWGFVWKSAKMLNSDGVAALLISATNIFAKNNRGALEHLLIKYRVPGIINFSDARFQLFSDSVAPAALCVFTNPPEKRVPRREFIEFWSPKANPDYSLDERVVLSVEDSASIAQWRAAESPEILTENKWGQCRDWALLDDLSTFSPILDHCIEVKRYKSIHTRVERSRSFETGRKWVVGQGFYAGGRELIDIPDDLAKIRYIEAKQEKNGFPRYIIPEIPRNKQEFYRTSKKLNQLGIVKFILNKQVQAPLIVSPQGMDQEMGFLRVAYSEKRVIFSKSIDGIASTGGREDARIFKILTATLNSRLAAWFLLHRGSAAGVERPKKLLHEFLSMPFPLPDESPNPEAGSKIIALMDEYAKQCSSDNHGGLFGAQEIFLPDADSDRNRLARAEAELEAKLAPHIYDYYGLTSSERQVIDDTKDYILPSLQPKMGSKKIPPLWAYPSELILDRYAYWLKTALEGNYSGGTSIQVIVYKGHGGLIVAEARRGGTKSSWVVVNESSELQRRLDELRKIWPDHFREGITHLPNVIFAEKNSLVLVKPNRVRHWMPSMGLNDAARIVANLRRCTAPSEGRL